MMNTEPQKTPPTPNPIKEGILIKNAGLVLLNSYWPLLFERLEFTKDKHWINGELQLQAVQYLQYVATGLAHTAAELLPLNKLLCGLPLSASTPDQVTVTASQQVLIEGLLKAVIAYWPAIGSTSIDAFRGNWLVRDGLLLQKEERWELTVEKRAYDLLIHRSPFSFSLIKYPWMDRPLQVNWGY